MFAPIRLLIVLVCGACSIAFAGTDASRDSLSIISQKIHKWQRYVTGHERQRAALQAQLKQQEIAISGVAQKLDGINQQLNQQQTLLTRVTREQNEAEAQIREQQALLHKQLRSTFLLSQPSTLKLLLNLNDTNHFGRQLALYRILFAKRTSMLEHLQTNLDSLSATKRKVVEVQRELQRLRQQAAERQHQLYLERQHRLQTMSKLQQEIRQGHVRVKQLKREKQALEQVISKLHQASESKASQASGETLPLVALTRYKHRLAWPLVGELLHRYGERIQGSDMFWHGILIKALEGEPVHAIFPGKVIFADWLQGFGFTLIIDHGHGFMSLYARNQVLLKAEGAAVSNRDIIARAGKSGGFLQSSLYFELRHSGTPVDPLGWLKNN